MPRSSIKETRADRCASKRMNQRIRTAAPDAGERIGILAMLIDRGNARRPMRAQEDEPANLYSLRAMWEEGETGESRAAPRLRFSPCSSTGETRADRCARKKMNQRIHTAAPVAGERIGILAMLIDRGNVRRPMRAQSG